MSEANTEPRAVGCLSRMVVFAVRLVFAIVVGLALGAGIFYGAIGLIQNVIQPIQANSQRIVEMDARLKMEESQLVQQTSNITARLQALEASSDRQKADFDELAGRIDELEAAQALVLENASNELESMLSTAEEDQAALKDDLGNFGADLKSLRSELNKIVKDYDSLADEIEALAQTIETNDEQLIGFEQERADNLTLIASMENKIQIFKAIEFLTRSRYNLVQNNLGLARQDIQSGYEILLGIEDNIPEFQLETYNEILNSLELAVANLPQKPVAAADDVDRAWNLLLQGLPDTPLDEAASETTQTDAAGATPTPTPTPTPKP